MRLLAAGMVLGGTGWAGATTAALLHGPPAPWLLGAEGPQTATAPPSPATYAVLVLGTFLGSCVMGVTGFGTAIVHLSTWATAGLLGFNCGTLRQAVITSSCATTTSALPLCLLSRARTNAVPALAISIPLLKAVGAPLGAAALKYVPPRTLEACVAGMLALMALLMNRLRITHAARAAAKWARQRARERRRQRAARVRARAAALKAAASAASIASLASASGSAAPGSSCDEEALLPLMEGYEASAGSEDEEEGSRGGGSGARAAGGSGSGTGSGLTREPRGGGQEEEQGAAAAGVSAGGSERGGGSPADDMVEVGGSRERGPDTGPEGGGGGGQQAAPVSIVAGKHGFWWLFSIGGFSGFWTGVLGGATGVHGPPLMLMYVALGTSKEQVRATNSLVTLVQDQWVGYWLAGLLHREEVALYAATAASGALGLLLGHTVQRVMRQHHFLNVMTGLMTLCFCLMVSAAAGGIRLQ